MKQEIRSYLDFLAVERGSSLHTLEAYERDITHLITFLEGHDIHQWEDVKDGDISAFLLSLREEGLASSSVNRALAAIRGFSTISSEKNVSSTIQPELLNVSKGGSVSPIPFLRGRWSASSANR